MYLKRLDIQGFKSFPEKARLEFDKGITAVVGPNGSGKSNISDAVRWVIGEQRPKSLRGEKMEDVIFAGTQNRKPLGFAEVSITMDNSDMGLPIEFSEVTVTRRTYRSGESDFLINGSPCRLKDVHELFMDTGVGREGYSIIGQGRIDEILSVKSEDRRKLFEEAAGIVKYKNRRQEALLKLEKEHETLSRVGDILNELEGRIEPLKEQSERAREYLLLKENLKLKDINLFVSRYDKINSELIEAEKGILSVNESISFENNNIEKTKADISVLKEKISEAEKNICELNDKIAETMSGNEKLEGNLRLEKQNLQNTEENIIRIKNESEAKANKIEGYENEVLALNSKAEDIKISEDSWESELAKKEEALLKSNEIVSGKEEGLMGLKTEMIEKIKLTTEIKFSIERNLSITEQFDDRKIKIEEEKKYIKAQINNNNINILASEKRFEESTHTIERVFEETKRFQASKNIIGQTVSDFKSRLDKNTDEIKSISSKLNLLKDMKKEREGFYKSVKTLLERKDDPSLPGINGVVAELFSVKAGFEVAIEAALGQAVQNIITDTDKDASKAINYLKKNDLGRATFLPVSAIKASVLENKEEVLKDKLVFGIGIDFIECDKKYLNIASSFLGRVIVTQNIEDAVNIARKFNYRFKIVTLDGDIINAGGSITGGSKTKNSLGVFSRNREISELEEAYNKSVLKSRETEENIASLEARLSEADKSLLCLSSESQKAEIAVAGAKHEIEQSKALLVEYEQKLKYYALEENQLDEQLEDARVSSDELKEKLSDIEEEIKDIDDILTRSQDSIKENKEERETLMEEITKLKVDISASRQNRVALDENIERILLEKGELFSSIQKSEEDIIRLEAKKEERQELILCITEDIRLGSQKLNQLKESMNAIFKEKEKTALELETLENDIMGSTQKISSFNNQIFKIEARKERLSEDLQKLTDEIWYEYEITYNSAKALPHIDISEIQLQKEVRELKDSIHSLGDVNVNSIEEYKKVSERHLFLSTQREDILKAESKLTELISKLSVIMEEQFKEQFKAISESFNEVFRDIFGGGKAELKMSDDYDVLNSPIEIIAKPPGKIMQNMLLLSGGERALTAIALLFSILKMKPSPFCILDEIEAALDDANIKRFSDYLKRLSNDTQFIVITHRKGTMEVSDVIYGITMQEQGISKLVSVSF
ncbi:MAG: chromosome segregation protein SMC [Lachnospiraceae bacterium]|nr:chromosome segregation protein SMC [Lachnospiraceae bacterium]